MLHFRHMMLVDGAGLPHWWYPEIRDPTTTAGVVTALRMFMHQAHCVDTRDLCGRALAIQLATPPASFAGNNLERLRALPDVYLFLGYLFSWDAFDQAVRLVADLVNQADLSFTGLKFLVNNAMLQLDTTPFNEIIARYESFPLEQDFITLQRTPTTARTSSPTGTSTAPAWARCTGERP